MTFMYTYATKLLNEQKNITQQQQCIAVMLAWRGWGTEKCMYV